MTRHGISGSATAIASDPVFAQIQAETSSAWSSPRSHTEFVADMVRLLQSKHSSVELDPVSAPSYEVKYYFEHSHPCVYHEICVCVTRLTIGDSGVNPVEMEIETVTNYTVS